MINSVPGLLPFVPSATPRIRRPQAAQSPASIVPSPLPGQLVIVSKNGISSAFMPQSMPSPQSPPRDFAEGAPEDNLPNDES